MAVSPRRPPQYDLPKAAPEPLRAVQVLVNTTDGHDRELLSEWLEERGIVATPDALAAARDVREALRELLIANTYGRAAPEAARALIEGVAARSRLSLRWSSKSTLELAPSAPGVDGALGGILAVAYAAMQDGTWSRLKACRNCRWAFYDYSRNRAAGWCSMSLCGNRLKTRAYRARRRALV
jgi:predicted RNA-binding Zn ribbon-like protein